MTTIIYYMIGKLKRRVSIIMSDSELDFELPLCRSILVSNEIPTLVVFESFEQIEHKKSILRDIFFCQLGHLVPKEIIDDIVFELYHPEYRKFLHDRGQYGDRQTGIISGTVDELIMDRASTGTVLDEMITNTADELIRGTYRWTAKRHSNKHWQGYVRMPLVVYQILFANEKNGSEFLQINGPSWEIGHSKKGIIGFDCSGFAFDITQYEKDENYGCESTGISRLMGKKLVDGLRVGSSRPSYKTFEQVKENLVNLIDQLKSQAEILHRNYNFIYHR